MSVSKQDIFLPFFSCRPARPAVREVHPGTCVGNSNADTERTRQDDTRVYRARFAELNSALLPSEIHQR